MKKLLMLAVAAAVLCAAWSALAQNIGDKGTAIWHGKSYPAEITKKKGGNCFVHWIGESGSYDEWQPCSSITVTQSKADLRAAASQKYSVGDVVESNWHGTWYKAHIIAVSKKGSYKVHYDGESKATEEWKTPNDLRPIR